MGNPSKGNNKSLDPLHLTTKALKEIRTNLVPFLQLLKDDDESSIALLEATKKSQSTKKRGRPTDTREDNDETSSTRQPSKKPKLSPHKRAEAEAAVAMAVGTLRYMGSRLRGLDHGRKKGDPLRVELDKCKSIMVSLRKLEGEKKKKEDGENDAKNNKERANNVTKSNEDKSTTRKMEGGREVKSSKSSAKKKQRR